MLGKGINFDILTLHELIIGKRQIANNMKIW